MEIMCLSTIQTLHKIRKSSGSFLFCQESNILLVNKTQGGFYMENINWNDKEEVLKLVQQDGTALEYTSEEVRNNKEVVLNAVQQDGWALEYASEKLRNDKDIVMTAIQKNGCALQFASDELCNNKTVVLNAVQRYGLALEFASKELQDNKKIVLVALQNTQFAFRYISPRLRQDYDVLKAAGLEPDIKQEPEKPDIDTVLGDARKWCQEHNDTPAVQPQHNIER